ncbi:hypothetical protein BC834DRAFT_916615 [Gloeopeniophorella convolvens]|nr:hypothetical protein BC834DRAFT_916615 [Gloeopeniophorella convolvens]
MELLDLSSTDCTLESGQRVRDSVSRLDKCRNQAESLSTSVRDRGFGAYKCIHLPAPIHLHAARSNKGPRVEGAVLWDTGCFLDARHVQTWRDSSRARSLIAVSMWQKPWHRKVGGKGSNTLPRFQVTLVHRTNSKCVFSPLGHFSNFSNLFIFPRAARRDPQHFPEQL